MEIKLCGICKKYLRKTVLTDVTVTFSSGKIHALLGENGAGKSTLAGIISGNNTPSCGTLLLDGKEVVFTSAKDALAHGIVIVHQRPLLADSITSYENILLGANQAAQMQLKKNQIAPALLKLKTEWAPLLKPSALVKDLGGDGRFYTALLGALLQNPHCLILDEPSALLDVSQRKNMYTSLRKLAATGCTVIVITHSTAEATTYADTITVLKDGVVFKQYGNAAEYENEVNKTASFTAESTASASCTTNETHPFSVNRMNCFSLENVMARPKNKPALLNATITVDYGSITMISGLQESALGTLEDVVTGMSTFHTTGTAHFFSNHGEQYTLPLSSGKLTTHFLRAHHAAIVPSDRTFRASNPSLTVEQMLTVYCANGDIHEHAKELITQADVHISPEEKAADLSGGMLQRLILTRELSLSPDFIILSEPMQGLDTRAQSSLCKTLVSLAKEGKAVLILGAADFPLSICSRVYSLEGGVTTLSFSNEKDSEHTV